MEALTHTTACRACHTKTPELMHPWPPVPEELHTGDKALGPSRRMSRDGPPHCTATKSVKLLTLRGCICQNVSAATVRRQHQITLCSCLTLDSVASSKLRALRHARLLGSVTFPRPSWLMACPDIGDSGVSASAKFLRKRA